MFCSFCFNMLKIDRLNQNLPSPYSHLVLVPFYSFPPRLLPDLSNTFPTRHYLPLCRHFLFSLNFFVTGCFVAGRSGFVHDQALANERAGIFFLETNDEFWASFYLSRARDLYRDWGAQAKVDSMNGMYDSLLSSSEPKRGTAGHKGRSRFIDVSKIHKKLNFDNISLTTSRSTH
mmetsp:Transcript_10194/g.14859  ORF Transcript_10194/g.14859 Transcript_10194/m.14859 type:complete len:175 (+) Transcript_10194:3301-3825(+)